MLNCLHSPASVSGISADIALPERRRLRFRWQLKQQLHDPGPYGEAQWSFLAPTAQASEFPGSVASEVSELGEVVSGPGMALGGWPETARVPAVEGGDGNGMGCAICRTAGCPPAAPTAEWGHGGRGDSASASGVATESFGKRKVEKLLHHKVGGREFEGRAKRTKGCPSGGESKTTEESRNNTEASPETSKEDSKFSVVQQKPDYIHVRARRGQATDSHSLAERVRREKISERMNHLQDLVPGCSKITGKAAMLDEIINYIQSLQKQVEVLSMKLAAVNDTLFVEEVIPAGPASFPMADPAFPQYNPLQQAAASGFEVGVCPPELGFEGAVMPIPQPLVDVSSFSQIQTTSTWEAGLQSLCGEDPQGRYPFHMGCVEADNVEMSGEAGNLKMDI